MSGFTSIAIAGATGHTGYACFTEFVAQKWTVRALVSKETSEKKDTDEKLKGSTVIVVDYSNQKSLQEAVRGVDVILCAFRGDKMFDNQTALLEAAKAEKVKRFVPSDFGNYSPAMADPKCKYYHPVNGNKGVWETNTLRKSGVDFTIVHCSLYPEFFFSEFFGFDFQKGTVSMPLDGKIPVAISWVTSVGKWLPHILNNEHSKNAAVQVCDGNVSWLEAVEYWDKISGKKLERTYVSQEDYEKKVDGYKGPNPFATFGDKIILSYIAQGTGGFKEPFNVKYFPKIEGTAPLKYLDQWLKNPVSRYTEARAAGESGGRPQNSR